MVGKKILNSCKAPIRFLKDNNFRANDRGSFEMTVKYSIYQKTKYVHVFDVPNHVCTGFDPEGKTVTNMSNICAWGKHREWKLFPRPPQHVLDLELLDTSRLYVRKITPKWAVQPDSAPLRGWIDSWLLLLRSLLSSSVRPAAEGEECEQSGPLN